MVNIKEDRRFLQGVPLFHKPPLYNQTRLLEWAGKGYWYPHIICNGDDLYHGDDDDEDVQEAVNKAHSRYKQAAYGLMITGLADGFTLS